MELKKLFSSVNFPFLISLGVLSWLLLCYFNQVDKMLALNGHNPSFGNGLNAMNATTQTGIRHSEYELVLNFVCVFACIYLLSKLREVSQNCVAKQLHKRYFKQHFPQMKINGSIMKANPGFKSSELLSRKIQLEHELNLTKRINCLFSCRTATSAPPYRTHDNIEQIQPSTIFNDESSKTIPKDNLSKNKQIWEKYLKNEKLILQDKLPLISKVTSTTLPPNIFSTEDLHKANRFF